MNWQAISNIADPAFDRGWRGVELAKFACEDLDRAVNGVTVGQVIHTAIRDLAQVDPPRVVTPTPDPLQDVWAAQHALRDGEPTSPANAAAWAQHIREQVKDAKPLTERAS